MLQDTHPHHHPHMTTGTSSRLVQRWTPTHRAFAHLRAAERKQGPVPGHGSRIVASMAVGEHRHAHLTETFRFGRGIVLDLKRQLFTVEGQQPLLQMATR